VPETEVPGSTLVLRRADEADIPFVMATERRPGYERTVGRWEEAAHRAEMLKPGSAYFIGERDGHASGFAMLQDLAEPNGNVVLRRIAVAEQGQGVGRAILVGVMDWAFARPVTHRLWLTVAPHNEPARRLYRAMGFQEDGILREAHVNLAGERITSLLMSILRPEWEGQRSA
jgi:RimJ/RimL family protein N-acetyltransferase